MTQLKDEMSKGQISFEMVSEAMKVATSEGGKFYNAMEGQSKSTVGRAVIGQCGSFTGRYVHIRIKCNER